MTEPLKITQKIVDQQVKKVKGVDQSADRLEITVPEPVGIHEGVAREEILAGTTYKIKPNGQFSYYITINNIEIDNKVYPFEVFINSKDTKHFEWTATLTRLISAIFRKGGDTRFIIDELAAIHSPSGGYWSKDKVTGKGKYYQSLVNEIGDIIKLHLDSLDDINNCNKEPKKYVVALEDAIVPSEGELTIGEVKKGYTNAKQCPDCNNISVVKLDGCDTCLECGYSKCG